MSELVLNKSTMKLTTGDEINLTFNESDDILEIFFGENEPSTGIELTDNILLRINRKTGRASSLTIQHFSILAERTELGPRSYPLDRLEELPEDLRELTIYIISRPPINQFIKLSHFQESPTKQIPLTYVEPYQSH